LALLLAGGLAGGALAQEAALAGSLDDPLLRFDGVEFEGVADAALENLKRRVSLARMRPGTGLRASRFRHFLRILPREVDEALQPFGFYSSEVEVTPKQQQGRLGARVRIDPGAPTTVRVERLAVEGEGAADRSLRRALARFRPGQGEQFVHAQYEDSKATLNRLLGERGYFDSELLEARAEVLRARAEARLNLVWRSGPRYRFGDTRIASSQFREGLLDPLLPYRADQPYRQSQLLVLQQRLADLDWFGRIDVQPRLRREPHADEHAPSPAPVEPGSEIPPQIGIDVELEPAPRNLYRAGLGYGTDTGPALKLGYTRRWINERGHRLETDLLLGGQRSSALLRYRIPAFERLNGWWTLRAAAREESFFGARAEIFEASLLRDGRWRGNLFSAGLIVQQEQFNSEGAFLVYPQASIERSQSDDPLYPSRGFKWTLLGRWGSPALGADLGFRQLLGSVLLVRSVDRRTRILLRAEAGSIRSGDFERLPPSLRFYAGGDRSVRGYGYQELGPLFEGDQRVGGRKLLVGSVEVERMFTRQWGGAVFIDAGNAYGRDFEPAVGVGLGLRWRSPVGPVQLDVGHGLDDPDRAIRLHIQLGPPL
jgi:translocation and assembly module TamA